MMRVGGFLVDIERSYAGRTRADLLLEEGSGSSETVSETISVLVTDIEIALPFGTWSTRQSLQQGGQEEQGKVNINPARQCALCG